MNLFRKNDPNEEKVKKFAELEKDSGNLDMLNYEKATWLTSRGNHYGQRKKYQEAIADFDEALKLKPDHLPAHFSLAIAYKESGNEPKAMEILRDAPDKMVVDGDVVATKDEMLKDMTPGD